MVRYRVMPAWVQPATFRESDGRITPRVEGLAEVFRRAGYPAALSADMHSWLTSHVAVVSPLANAIYHSGGNRYALDMQKDAVRPVVEAVREGFAVVRASGLPVTPPKLRLFEALPAAILVNLLQTWIRTPHFETVAGAHSLGRGGRNAMSGATFANWHSNLIYRTPAIDRLRESCEIYVSNAASPSCIEPGVSGC